MMESRLSSNGTRNIHKPSTPEIKINPKNLGVSKAVSSLFAILRLLPPSQIWSYEFFSLNKH